MFSSELNKAGIRCTEKDFNRYEEIFEKDHGH